MLNAGFDIIEFGLSVNILLIIGHCPTGLIVKSGAVNMTAFEAAEPPGV